MIEGHGHQDFCLAGWRFAFGLPRAGLHESFESRESRSHVVEPRAFNKFLMNTAEPTRRGVHEAEVPVDKGSIWNPQSPASTSSSPEQHDAPRCSQRIHSIDGLGKGGRLSIGGLRAVGLTS